MSQVERSPEESREAPDGPGAPDVTAGWMHDIVPYGIFTTDRALRITRWNQWLVTHSGLDARNVIGRPLAALYPDLAARRLLPRFARALDGEVSVLSAALHKYLLPFPVPLPESGRSHMLQSARIAPLPDGGVVAGTITIIEDVTQREFQAGMVSRQQEFDRLLSEALATLLQSTSPIREMDAIFATMRLALGLDTHVSYLFSSDRGSLCLSGAAGLAPRQRESVARLALTGADLGVLRAGAADLPPGAGGTHFAALHKIGLRGQWCFPLTVGGRMIGLVAFGSYQRDVIAPADAAVLERIARYVAIAIDRASRESETLAASRAKDDFLAALSHELRTPLNPVLLVASDGSGNGAFPAEAREAFRVIEKNVLLEARLIDDLLDLTRVAHDKLALELQPVAIHASLRDAIQTVRPEIAERRLLLRESFDDRGQVVIGDNGRLQQVFWNVLRNAVKFTAPGGEIAVRTAQGAASGEIAICIADTGVGMEPHELARAFEAFAQGDHAGRSGSHRFGGLGLGLAIGRKLVELHGGRIEARSEGKDRGSTFTIVLPLAGRAGAAAAPIPKAGGGDGAKAGRGTGLRILLVEDHPPTSVSLTRLLERRGYFVMPVASAQAALAAAEAAAFHVVLSDVGLPDENGFSLMRKLHDLYGLRGIALTGYGMDEDLVRSREAGFFAHLTKPVSVGMLERELDRFFTDADSP